MQMAARIAAEDGCRRRLLRMDAEDGCCRWLRSSSK